ncbi:hit finger domain protein [Sporothrix schenckii 1099-18]|uniref:Hit finger domain protein n=1 Tax=Sporothrix schenckii 1099-18 TaxID=1397361 RepID=A0A0F2MD72_SPOSC|nr:hit finger domain protein [Sporothrix schenckii 1099-18]KJR87014.1 hit finger domain protein [Sporothrix schenckii 1099-18]
MPSSPPPVEENSTPAPADESREGGQSPMSHVSSETAAAAPSTASSEVPASGKRSAPMSSDRAAGDTTEASTVAVDGGAASTHIETPRKTAEEAPTDEANETITPPAKRRTVCGVCNKEPSKYKCSRCPLAYCSVTCSRIHRDNHPPDAPTNDDKTKSTRPGASAVPSLPPKPAPPAHPFHVLDDAPELRHLFEKYPTLPERLKSIYEATQPPKSGGGGNKAPIPGLPMRLQHKNSRGGFGGGRGGRGGGGGGMSSRPWTKEMGLREGQKALRRARVDPSEDGDAVRAYCETVTYLLARDADDRVGTGTGTWSSDSNASVHDVSAVVRDELAVEANQAIKTLLDAEGRH